MIAISYRDTDDGILARVTFTLPQSLWADTVCLVGDFNDWSPASHPFGRTRDGGWTLAVELPAGRRYAFYYLRDGAWMGESHADAFTRGERGDVRFVVDTDPRGSALREPLAIAATTDTLAPVAVPVTFAERLAS
jgi:hypothetical protein